MTASNSLLNRRLWIVLLLFAVGVYLPDLKAQRRRPAPARTAPTARVDYSKFSHSTKQHQEACTTCHKAPTANWQKVRGFPDVADFPGHDACVRCHRAQFFKSPQPVICSDCHSKTSPRDDVRFPFRNPVRGRQFKTEFPHDKHQDVIALLRSEPIPQRSGFFSHHRLRSLPPDDRPDYNNCTICHATNNQPVNKPVAGWPDGFVPVTDAFKAVPSSHAACFNCHWKNQKPTKDNCGDCHKLDPSFKPNAAPARISMKFKH